MNLPSFKHAMEATSLLNSFPGAIGYKNKDSIYIAGNQLLASYMGYQSPNDIAGLTDNNIKSEMAELAPKFVEQDREVIKSGEQQHIDIGHYPNGDLQIHFSVKKPLFDENHETIGTVYSCFELQPSFLSHLYHDLLDIKAPIFFTIGGHYEKYQLSHRESECLFYLTRGLTAKEIAQRLHLSRKTVECYTDRIKIKLACSNRHSLIDKAIHLGFIFNIPLSLFERR